MYIAGTIRTFSGTFCKSAGKGRLQIQPPLFRANKYHFSTISHFTSGNLKRQ